MGGFEAGTLVSVEPSLKYHPGDFEVLTQIRYPDRGPCMVGSLTGAVSSQKVTEEHEGTLGTVGNRAVCARGISVLDCEAHKPNRCESRS